MTPLYYAKIFTTYRQAGQICNYLPSHLWIEPSNTCNLECITCPSKNSTRQKGFMSLELFTKIMEQAKNKPVIYLFMAGEPLLHPDIFAMIRIAKEHGASPALFTNATLLDSITAENLLKAEPDWLGFSFDGYEKAVYEKIRKNGNFESALANIEGFLKLKRKLGKAKPFTCLSLIEPHQFAGFTTLERKKEFKKRLSDMGLDQFDVSLPHTWAGKIDAFSRQKIKRKKSMTQCPTPWTSLSILWDGRVVPRCFDINAEYVAGDLTESTLEEIWNGLPMRRLRRIIGKGQPGFSLCRSCHIPEDPVIFGVPQKVIIEMYDLVRTWMKRFR